MQRRVPASLPSKLAFPMFEKRPGDFVGPLCLRLAIARQAADMGTDNENRRHGQ